MLTEKSESIEVRKKRAILELERARVNLKRAILAEAEVLLEELENGQSFYRPLSRQEDYAPRVEMDEAPTV